MFRWLCFSVTTVALLAPASLQAADNPKDILARAVKAHGGEEYLTKMLAAQSTEKGKMDIPGVGEIEFTSETSYMLPNQFKNVIEFEVMNQKLKVLSMLNKDKITVLTTVAGQEIDSSDSVKEAFQHVPHILKVSQLAPLLKEKGYSFELIGEEKVDGKPALGVRVSAKGQKDVNLYFDKESALMVRMDYRSVDPMSNAEVSEERIMTDYKKNKDGIPIARKMLVKHDGKKFMEAEVIEMTYLEKLPESEFQK